MLSYQHIFHAGNMADVHKHCLLAWVLSYLTQKDKPLSYIETHSGRGLYDLGHEAAQKTGEAAQGIERLLDKLDPDHPYARQLAQVVATHGKTAYPGSPLLADGLLRAEDTLHLAELHPTEFAALQANLPGAHCYQRDGLELALSICPPTPRRGVLLIDPSYEVKTDYETIPQKIAQIHRKWSVGVILLWYPILDDNRQAQMCARLRKNHPDAAWSEVRFPPARKGHRMIGSGMFALNPPFGFDSAAANTAALFQDLTDHPM